MNPTLRRFLLYGLPALASIALFTCLAFFAHGQLTFLRDGQLHVINPTAIYFGGPFTLPFIAAYAVDRRHGFPKCWSAVSAVIAIIPAAVLIAPDLWRAAHTGQVGDWLAAVIAVVVVMELLAIFVILFPVVTSLKMPHETSIP